MLHIHLNHSYENTPLTHLTVDPKAPGNFLPDINRHKTINLWGQTKVTAINIGPWDSVCRFAELSAKSVTKLGFVHHPNLRTYRVLAGIFIEQ